MSAAMVSDSIQVGVHMLREAGAVDQPVHVRRLSWAFCDSVGDSFDDLDLPTNADMEAERN